MGQSRALLNADILLQVFKTLVEEDLFKGRRTLAAAVLVSKTFHLPAVKVLWTEIPSIFPLLYLFSSFVKMEDEGALQRRGLGGYLGSGVRCHIFVSVVVRSWPWVEMTLFPTLPTGHSGSCWGN